MNIQDFIDSNMNGKSFIPGWRPNSSNIQLGAIQGQNQAIILGDLVNGYLKLDYLNKRIIVNDGSNNRILIGYGPGLF